MTSATDPAEVLRQKGITLPPPLSPAGQYSPVRQVGNLVFLSGMGPTNAPEGVPVTGKVGRDVSLAQAQHAAYLTCLNALSSLEAHCGSLSAVAGFAKVNGYINCAPGFIELPPVIDGFSSLINELWPESIPHARAAIGVAELPFDICVEVECVAELR